MNPNIDVKCFAKNRLLKKGGFFVGMYKEKIYKTVKNFKEKFNVK